MPRVRRRSMQRRLRIALLAVLAASLAGWTIYSRRQPGRWQHVFATREGMIGSMTSSRKIIGANDRFVALPDRRALGRDVEIRYRGRAVVVPVLDVGPWNVDDPYDLSDAVFAELGLSDNDYVDWRFVHRDYVALPRL